MPARTTREQARQRILNACQKALDRVIPPEEEKAIKGQTFIEWEDQADAFDDVVTGTLLEELAGLSESAQVDPAMLGSCPYCGCKRLYLQRHGEMKNKTIRTKHGQVALGQQSVRCRRCGRSFFPSAS